MTDINKFISQDWEDLAINNSTFIDELGKYSARIYDVEGSEYISNVEDISFDPEINTAPVATVDIEPRTSFESSTIIGGEIEIFVDEEILFAGKIMNIEYSSTEGDFYTITAESPGFKLTDKTVDENVFGVSAPDYIKKTVHRYHDSTEEMKNLRLTDDEELEQNINDKWYGDILVWVTSDESAMYNIGLAETLNKVYCKIRGNFDINVYKNAELPFGNNTPDYSETVSVSNSKTFGEWVEINPNITGTGEDVYGIEFAGEYNSGEPADILFDWITINQEEKLTATIDNYPVDTVLTDTVVEKISERDEWEESFEKSGDSDWPGYFTDDSLSVRQTCFTTDLNANAITGSESRVESDVSISSNSEASSNDVLELASTGDYFQFSFNLNYDIPIDDFQFAFRSERGNLDTQKFNVYLNDSRMDTSDDGDLFFKVDRQYYNNNKIDFSNTQNFHWLKLNASDSSNLSNLPDSLDGTVEDRPEENEVTVTNIDSSNYSSDKEVTVTVDNSSDITYNFDVTLKLLDGSNNIMDVEGQNVEVIANSTNDVLFEDLQDNVSNFEAEVMVEGDVYLMVEVEEVDEDSNWTRFDTVAPNDSRFVYSFPAETGSNDYLEGPELYPAETRFTSPLNGIEEDKPRGLVPSPTFSKFSMSSFKISISSQDTLNGKQFISWRHSKDNLWRKLGISQNSSTVEEKTPVPVAFVQPMFGMAIGERTSATPKEGYKPLTIDSYEVSGDLVDYEIFYGKGIESTRLSAISSVADETLSTFRFEGNKCRIFKKGSISSDVDLVLNDVTSSVDIEDTYSSCEVIGDGVRSGVVEASDAPDFVDRHRQIKDESITREVEALRQAQSFLSQNSDIEYSGDISTLPTRVPVGTKINGNIFTHGEDVIVTSASYSKDGTDISCGKQKNLALELIELTQ